MLLDLKRPWRDFAYCSIDFEATSVDPMTCEPVEVSCVRFNADGNIVDRFTSLLRTKDPIPAESTKVHGITDEMVKDAPTLEEVAVNLAALADNAVPLSFNRKYDRTILHRYVTGSDVTLFDPAQPWLCTFAMAWSADRWEPGAGRHKLTACCERRGIRVPGAHRAEADAIMSGMLFFSMMTGCKPETSMWTLIERVDTREAEREVEHQKWRKKCLADDRLIWRQYACVLLADPRLTLVQAAEAADEMLALEKGRFLGL